MFDKIISFTREKSAYLNKNSFIIKNLNNITFLSAESETSFSGNNIFVSGFNNFVKMTSLSFGRITNSKIDIKSSIVDMFQNANLTVKDTAFLNEKDFKFSLQESSSLYLTDSQIEKNKFLSMTYN